MKNWLLPLALIPFTALAAAAQQRHSSFCPANSLGEDILLSVCTHESGMAPPIQPRLYIRVHTNGAVEYEMANYDGLVTKHSQLTSEEMAVLKRILAMPDMALVKTEYPVYRRFDDSSLETRVMMRVGSDEKSFLLRNFVTFDCDLGKYYPAPLVLLMRALAVDVDRATGTVKEIPQLSFDGVVNSTEDCSLDWTEIEIYADYEHRSTILASGKIVNERDILYDHEGSSKREIDIRFEGTAIEIRKAKDALEKVKAERFGGRGRILARGKYDRKNSQFILHQVRQVEPIDVPFDGKINGGINYVDTYDFKLGPEDEQLATRLKQLAHHVGRVEFLNSREFPQLTRSGLHSIVFRITSTTTWQASPGRWNDIYTCTILEVQ